MQTSNTQPRLNYNIPRGMVNEVRAIAAEQGMEPSWWLKKVIERAVQEARRESPKRYGN